MGKGLITVLLCVLTLPLAANTDSLKQLLAKPGHDTTQVNVCTQLARVYMNKNTDSALLYALRAYVLAKSINLPSKQGAAANIIGVVYLNRAQYDKSLSYHLEAVALFETSGNKRGLAFSYNNIGSVNFHTGKYDEALAYYKKSLALKQELKLMKEVSSTLINIGNIFMKKNEHDSCVFYYQSALDNAKKNADFYNISVSLMNLGEAYFDAKNYPRALKYYRQALAINLERNDHYHQANCYSSIGKIQIETGDLAAAEGNLFKAMEIAEAGGMKPVQLNIYKYLSKLFEKKGETARALSYYKQFHELNDTIYNTENTRRIEEMKAGYESELKDRKIAELNKDKAIAEEKAWRETVYRNFLIAAFILAGLTSGVLYRNIRLKQKTNRLLLEKNRQIEQHQLEIEEKNTELAQFNKELMTENISVKYEILKSKINPHFLFNSLSTLSTLIIKNQKQAVDFVGRFSKLYRSILKSGDSKLVTLEEEMELAGHYLYMQKMRFGENITVTVDIPQAQMKNQLPPFTIQLLLENAIKHNVISEENRLGIEIRYHNGAIQVTNNLQAKPVKEPSTGIGQQNITDRYRLLGATAPEFGVRGRFYVAKIPLLKNEPAYELRDN